MKLSASVFGIDYRTFFRATLIALLLIADVLISRLRTIPPISIVYFFIILFILTGWWIWRTIQNKGLPRTPITIPLFIYLLAVLISTIFSVDQRRSLDGLIATFAVVSFFFLICDLLIYGWKVETLEIALLIFVTYLISHGLLKIFDWYKLWYTIQVPEYPPYLLRYRLFGVSAWPSKLVMLINAGIPFAIFRMSNASSFIRKVLWGSWLLASIVVIIYSDTRGGFVSLVFILAITIGWLLFSKRVPFRENPVHWLKKNSSIILTFIVYIGVFFLISNINKLISPHSGYVRHGRGITAGRIDFWRVAINIFLKYPLVGSGPITYPRFYIQELPGGINGWISPHAHNLILNTASQLGILGLIALGSIFISLAVVLYRSTKFRSLILIESLSSNSHLLVGTIAALSGVLIQSMFDRVEEIPHTMFSILLIVCIGLYVLGKIEDHGKRNQFISIIFFAILIFVTGLFYRQYTAHSSQLLGLQSAYERNWKEAADHIETATDYDPELIFYYEQQGYALGALSLSPDTSIDGKALQLAIDSYSVVNENIPIWAPNYVNLSQLLEHAGKPEESFALLESIPGKWFQVWPFLTFFLADKYQSLGQFSEADDLYRDGLVHSFWMKETAICQKSEACKDIATQIQIEDNELFSTHELALTEIEGGSPNEALSILDAIPLSESSPLIWVDRAAAHLALDEIPQSEYALEIAKTLDVLNQPIASSIYALTASNLLLRSQKTDEAIEILESVVRPMIRLRTYEYIVYQRFGFPDHLLPSLAILEQNKFDLMIYSQLGDLYRENGNLNDAEWAVNQAIILSSLLETE